MAIRHVVTIQVAPGKAAEFTDLFKTLQRIALPEQGDEEYELFRNMDDPEKVVLLERWASQASLAQHRQAEHPRNAAAIDALAAPWAPGTTPTIERFDA